MFQRIQTVYLFLGAVAIGMLFFFPGMGFSNVAGNTWDMDLFKIALIGTGEEVVNIYPLGLLAIIVFIIYWISIALFKNRVIQMRLTLYNTILQVGLIGLGILYIYKAKLQLDAEIDFHFWSILPLVGVILSIMAFRGIRRDELLIKSLDRIR